MSRTLDDIPVILVGIRSGEFEWSVGNRTDRSIFGSKPGTETWTTAFSLGKFRRTLRFRTRKSEVVSCAVADPYRTHSKIRSQPRWLG